MKTLTSLSLGFLLPGELEIVPFLVCISMGEFDEHIHAKHFLKNSTQCNCFIMVMGQRKRQIFKYNAVWLNKKRPGVYDSIVGSMWGELWNSNTSSQLHGGYVKVNSAAKKRAPKSVSLTQSCAPAPWRTGFQNPLLFFSASTAKSVISGVKWNEARGLKQIWSDVLKMANNRN